MSDLHMQIANLKRQLEEQRKTLRDEMAMSVLNGLISKCGPEGAAAGAKIAYQYSDAMMEARK